MDLTDAELSALALAEDPEQAVGPDAIPLDLLAGRPTTLGSWYMPPIATRRLAGWRLPVVLAIVCTLLLLEALGLCSAFGQVVIG